MRRPIHVAEVLEATDGGARTHVLHILRGLDRRRFRLTLIASTERNRRFRADMESLRAQGVATHELPMVRPIAPWRDAPALARLVQLLRRLRPDLVHTHASKAGALGRAAARLAGVPAVLHTPHVFYFQGQTGLRRWFYRSIERAMIPLTSRLILLCEGQRALAQRELGIEAERLAVIPNGVDAAHFAPRQPKEAARRALGIAPDAPVIGTITRFAPQKRCDLLLAAMAQVLDQVPAARGLVVGDGPLRDQVMRQAQELRIHERILWMSRCDDPLTSYEAMSLFILSSQYEGLPYTLLEAMACAVPAVAPRIAGCEDAIEHGATGLLAAPGDAEDLARCALRLLAEPALAQAIGQAARRAVMERFSLEKFLDRLSALYELEALRAREP